MNQNFSQTVDTLLRTGLRDGVFPTAAIGISVGYVRHRKIVKKSVGLFADGTNKISAISQTFFDLASLTKPLATTLAILVLLKEGKISGLGEELPLLIAEDVPSDKMKISLFHLLNHCSGLPAHRQYFRELIKVPESQRRNDLLKMILAEPLLDKPGKIAVYSDLGFMLLGMIVERKCGMKFDEFVHKKILSPLGVADNLCFTSYLKQKTGVVVAPTEECPWRGRLLCGEVSDENAFAMGGVAGHAGLFGTIDGVLSLANHILDQWKGREQCDIYRFADLQKFLKRQNMIRESTWALGFDTPSEVGSSAGSLISPRSVGHLGFTGTSFWIDAPRDLVVVLLTNRVHPRRDNQKIKAFRPLVHEAIMANLHLLTAAQDQG